MARGRKPSGSKLFLPGMVNEIDHPLMISAGGDDAWRRVILQLTTVPKGLEGFDAVVIWYRKLCLAEMARLKWDGRIKWQQAIKGKGILKATVDEIKLDGRLLRELLELVREVWEWHGRPLGYSHPAYWFEAVVEEWEALCKGSNSDTLRTKKIVVAEFQKQNNMLRNLESNPFVRPATHMLFNKAMLMADQVPRFRPDYLTPYVNTRGKVVSFMRKGESEVKVFHKTTHPKKH